MEKYKTIILGAGITGLYTAKTLLDKGENSVLVIEKNDFVGGICSSFDKDGYTIDYGPHKLFSLMPGIMEEFKEINGDDNLVVQKVNSLFFLGKKFQFPIKPLNMINNISPKTAWAGITIPISLMKSMIIYGVFRKKDDSFEDYLVKGFGRSAYKILFEGYAWKVWTDPKQLSRDIAMIRIPLPSITDLVKKTFIKKSQTTVNAKEFYYPKHGMRYFCDNIAKMVEEKGGKISLGDEAIKVTLDDDGYVIKAGTKIYRCENLVSTIPVDKLIKIYGKKDENVIEAASKLKYNDLSLVYLFFDKPKVVDENWIFFPELKYSFNRLSEQKSFSKYTVPESSTVLCAEVTNPKINVLSETEIVERVSADLVKANIIKDKNEIRSTYFMKMDDIYPVYDLEYKHNLNTILEFLDDQSLITVGRFGLFNYNNIDHCFDMAKRCAEYLLSGADISRWQEIREEFLKYRIVD